MNGFKKILTPLILFFIGVTAHATYIDINMLSFSDSLKTDSTVAMSRTMYDISFGTLMGKPDNWIWAVTYGSSAFSDKSTTTTTFSVADLGVKFGYFWTKQKSWFTTITYNLQSTAKYNDGTTASELRGTSIRADLGYAFWPSENLGVSARIFYYAPTFKESIVDTSITKVSYSRSLIAPCISLMFNY